MSKKQVTFADIAEYTNFSKTTISRYFNHPDSPIAKTAMDLLVRQMDEQKKRVPCSQFYDRILQDRLVFWICVSSCLIKDYNYTPQ